MGLKDLIITPVYIILLSVIAYFIRPYVTNARTKKYFLPALWVRFAGAIALGLIYQFYYKGGDTFNYFNQAGVVYEALQEDFNIGLKLLLSSGTYESDTYNYATKILWYRAEKEFFIIKLVATLSVITFYTYSSNAVFFAAFNFAGLWMMFSVLSKRFPNLSNKLAISILFVPSCIFWGSGILKDTLTLGALGFLFWSLYQMIENSKIDFMKVAIGILATWIIVSVKFYIFICFLPSAIFWIYLKNISRVRNRLNRLLIAPFLILFFLVSGYFLTKRVSEYSDRYNISSLAQWAYITSNDIRYWTGKDAGSGYDLGLQDGTWGTLIKLAPAAINVSLFRPYLWEVNNPLMLLASIESLIVLLLTVVTIKPILTQKRKPPVIVFMLSFSLMFAFAVGVSTYNFGSLSRYKLPLLPFYISSVLYFYEAGKIKKSGV